MTKHSRGQRAWRATTAVVVAVLVFASLGTSTAYAGDETYEYSFEFVNGQTVTGTSSDKVGFIAEAGGTDANNPIGMEVHLSCSDEFPGGYGEKDGPDAQRDSAWQIESWTINKVKDGEVKKSCGGGIPPAPEPMGDPAIDIEKHVNGVDADRPANAPGVTVGDTVTLDYIVTNTGEIALDNIVVTDDDLGVVACPKDTLEPDESMDCTQNFVDVVEPGLVAMNASVTGEADAGPAVAQAPIGGKGKAFTFVFVNGATISGVDDGYLPNAGGTDVDNPIGMEVHLSCSDDFPGGFGEKDGPDPQRDSAWQIASYQIAKFDKGEIKKSCGDTFAPNVTTVTDEDPIHYFAEDGDPGIDLVKTVNGDDANDAPGPVFQLGQTIEVEYIVTNTGTATLTGIVVVDFDLGVRPCAATTLAPGQSTTCQTYTHVIDYSDVGFTHMEALVVGTGAGQGVFDEDPINFRVFGT